MATALETINVYVEAFGIFTEISLSNVIQDLKVQTVKLQFAQSVVMALVLKALVYAIMATLATTVILSSLVLAASM